MTTHETSSRRRVLAKIGLSLDGRVNGPGGENDMIWVARHGVSDGVQDRTAEIMSTATTVLLGRKNYVGFHGYWPSVASDESADPRTREISRWLDAVEKVVFSRTLTDAPWKNSRIAGADLMSEVEQLRRQEGGDIVVLNSASIIRALLTGGQIDRLAIDLCPELSGGGELLFTDAPATSWDLSAVSQSSSEAVCLTYDKR